MHARYLRSLNLLDNYAQQEHRDSRPTLCEPWQKSRLSWDRDNQRLRARQDSMRCEYAEEPGKDGGVEGVLDKLFCWLYPIKTVIRTYHR